MFYYNARLIVELISLSVRGVDDRYSPCIRRLPAPCLFHATLAMTTFNSSHQKWRNHPAFRWNLRHLFPGFTWGLAAVVVVTIAEQFVPAEHHGHSHFPSHIGPMPTQHSQEGDSHSLASGGGHGGHGGHS